MRNLRKRIWCLVILLLVGALMAGCSIDSKPPEKVSSELKVENCSVSTILYECSYPQAMIDVIRVEEAKEGNVGDLDFYAMLIDSEQKIFTLKYNSNQGDWTLEYEKSDGSKVPISFDIYQLPENLIVDDQSTFLAAQEMVNDIVGTLKLK